MNQNNSRQGKNVFYIIMTAFLVLGLSISLQSLLAVWQNPGANPPTNLVFDLLDASGDTQSKQGTLNIGGDFAADVVDDTFVVSSALNRVGIGVISPTEKLDVNGKIKAETPLASDSDDIVTTKGYVDAQVVSAGVGMYETSCAWRYDVSEGIVQIGAATNWECTPPACAAGYTSLVINHEPSGVSCPGSNICSFNSTNNYHPVVVGRSVRVCAPN